MGKCEFFKLCGRENSVTCTSEQYRSDGGIYCGHLRSMLEARRRNGEVGTP